MNVRVGDIFGNWTVIDAIEDYIYPNHGGMTKYIKGIRVQCPHGVQTRRSIFSLKTGATGGCKKCGAHKKFKGSGNLSGSYLNSIQLGAKKRKLEYSVSPDYLWGLFQEQGQRCALSGVHITLDPKYSANFGKKKFTQTASLDRVNSSEGYIEGNVQWIHKYVNIMKNDLNQDQFIQLCELISKTTAPEPKMKIVARTTIEGIHRWKNCPIEEVSFLRDYHRHIFHISAYAYVTHSDRDIEFIKLAHDIKAYLTSKYFNTQYQCAFFDDNSCEMIAQELVNHFNLYEVEVNEDGEGGSIVRQFGTNHVTDQSVEEFFGAR